MSSTENNYVNTDLGNVALNSCGEYNADSSYEYLDTVNYEGGSYFCKVEFPKKISGIAPKAGVSTEFWQLLTIPGDATSEYIKLHDEVVNKAKKVETSRAAVELSQTEVEAAQTDVSQMRQDTQEAAEEAASSRDSAAGYAQSAETSRTAAKESEDNINAQVTEFDTHVAEKTSAAETAITEARRAAVNAVSTKQDDATQAVTDEGDKQIKNVEDAGTEQIGKAKSAGASAVSAAGAAGVSAVNAVKAQQTASIKAVADEGTQQVTAVNTAGSTQVSTIETKGADQVKAIQEASENALQNISNGVDKGLSEEGKAADAKATGEAISNLTEDISNKITKFYASNQGETHITDSDNGKIQDMMVYGKSSQDGTPSVENPVEIKSVVNPIVKVYGKNMMPYPKDNTVRRNGVTLTVKDGKYTLVGKPTTNTWLNIYPQVLDSTAGDMLSEKPLPTKGKKLSMINGGTGYTLNFRKVSNSDKVFGIEHNDAKLADEDSNGVFLYIYNIDKAYNDTFEIMISDPADTTSTVFEPYTEQEVSLPYTLNAIPVSSGGNVTINGQQYVADYVDVERGKIVRMCGRETLNTKNGEINEEYRLAIYPGIHAHDDGGKECIFSRFEWKSWETCMAGAAVYIKNIKKPNNEFYTAQELKELSLDFEVVCQLAEKQETDLPTEQITAFKALATYYPTTNISVNSEQLDGYTVFNYPISMANGWNYVKQQLNDNRDYIYDMDTQSAEAYVNSEYAVALTELEV